LHEVDLFSRWSVSDVGEVSLKSDASGFSARLDRNLAVRELLVRSLMDGAVDQFGSERDPWVEISTLSTVLLGMLVLRSAFISARFGSTILDISDVSGDSAERLIASKYWNLEVRTVTVWSLRMWW
jgi:hypothetical protein